MCRNTFRRLAVLVALAAGACTDHPTAPWPNASARAAPPTSDLTRLERLARALAVGLRAPSVRAALKAQLDASRYREHKLLFQRFVAAQKGAFATDLTTDVDSGVSLELYLPVPTHRATWRGDGRVLVATALRDHDVPVAFDTAGNRYLLSPDVPPAIPVLALVPVETDFTPVPSSMLCLDCGGGGGGGGGGDDPPPSDPSLGAPPPGLYMTQAHFTQTFEGWLKGSPEFELHILGQKGQTDSLMDYQCVGEKLPAPYYFDQNTLDWSGSVLLFSQTQLDDYKTKHPGQSVRVFAVEDDDTACQITSDSTSFMQTLALGDSLYRGLTAGTDSLMSDGKKAWRFAKAVIRFMQLVASLINTNDELVGNAVQDTIASEYHPGYNWIVKGEQNVTNGWIRLEMH